MQPEGFDVEQYFSEFADKSAMAEAARFRTIPTGSYTIQVTKREGRYFEQAAGGYWKPVFSNGEGVDESTKAGWRKGVRLTASAFGKDDPSRKLRTVSFDVSWEAKRDTTSGEYDRLFRKWEQLTRALFPDLKAEQRAEKSTGDILGAVMQYPIGTYITESFQVPAIDGSNKWTTPKSDEESKRYREAGYKSENFVQNLTKV